MYSRDDAYVWIKEYTLLIFIVNFNYFDEENHAYIV